MNRLNLYEYFRQQMDAKLDVHKDSEGCYISQASIDELAEHFKEMVKERIGDELYQLEEIFENDGSLQKTFSKLIDKVISEIIGD